MKRILILIPTYNEKDNIAVIISTIYEMATESLKKYHIDVLVIDDNSPDGTQDVVQDLQKTNKNIYMITGQKAGLGKAYMRGFEWGIDKKHYDAFVMMDADLSHDPHAIPSMIEALQAGADYVIGSRYAPGGSIPGNWPLLRIINSRVANNLARFLSGIDHSITDVTGGFKAIRVSAMDQIDRRAIDASGYFIQVSLLYQFWSAGFKIQEVPIAFADRRFGSSKLRLRDIVEFLYRAYRLNRNSHVRQLVRFALVGACGTLVNLGMLHVLIRYGQLDSLIAVALAIETSIITNFFMNHYFTFHIDDHGVTRAERRRSIPLKLLKFNVGMLSGAAIQFTVFALLHKLAGWQYILADLVAIAVAMSWNYWVSTRYVWRAAGVPVTPEEEDQA